MVAEYKKVDGNWIPEEEKQNQTSIKNNDSSLVMEEEGCYEPVTQPAFFLLLAVKPLSPPLQIEAVHQQDNILTGSNTFIVPRIQNKQKVKKYLCGEISCSTLAQLDKNYVVKISDPCNSIHLGVSMHI